jgi:hypothetical protein
MWLHDHNAWWYTAAAGGMCCADVRSGLCTAIVTRVAGEQQGPAPQRLGGGA